MASVNGTANFNEVKISALSFEVLVSKILSHETESHIHLAAASTITEANSDLRLRAILNHGITLCDSKPLSTWLNFRGHKIDQIRGVDLFREILKLSGDHNKHFFLGGTDNTLNKLIARVKNDYPSAEIAGFFSPKFGLPTEVEIKSWSNIVKNSGANILWIGLGSPKQDFVSYEMSIVTGKTVIAVGAAFDFLAGTVREAPRIAQVLGLEWFYRFCSEPKRLWQRYTFGNLKFIFLLLKDLSKKSKQ